MPTVLAAMLIRIVTENEPGKILVPANHERGGVGAGPEVQWDSF